MTTTTMILQSRALNTRAEQHEKNNNTLLASWMRESAEYFKNQNIKINNMLDDMCLGNYKNTRSKRDEFNSDWFKYEEEYYYNWEGEN